MGGKPIEEYAPDFWLVSPESGGDPVGFITSPWYHPEKGQNIACLLYTSPSPRDLSTSRMPSSA